MTGVDASDIRGQGPVPSTDHTVDEVCRRAAAVLDDMPTATGQTVDVPLLIDEQVRRVIPLAHIVEQQRVATAAAARLIGMGELDEWIRDPDIDEVLVNAGNDIWVDREGSLARVGQLESQPLRNLIERMLAPLGRRLDPTSPIVDARLADGSRVCAIMQPISVDGTCLSIRRFPADTRPLSAYVDAGAMALIHEVIDARCNVVVSGATSSGKTSLLASIISALPPTERVVVIEDTAELALRGQHVVRLEARAPSPDGPPPIGLPELVRTALRLRPDRLVVGEIRGDEVLGMVQAMNTGHDGSFSTCHANGPLDALYRLESLVLRASPTWPMRSIRQQLARSIDVVIHVARSSSGRREIASISEVVIDDSADASPATRLLACLDEGELVPVAALGRRR
jgi:pilus assembly protein CpaF